MGPPPLLRVLPDNTGKIVSNVEELKVTISSLIEEIPNELSAMQMSLEEKLQEAANKAAELAKGSNNQLAQEAVSAWGNAAANHQERFWRNITPAILATQSWKDSL